MIAALELLLLFVALVAAVLLYRWLIHSAWFTRLVGGVVDAPAETDSEVLDGVDRAVEEARQREAQVRKEAAEKKAAAAALRRRTKKSS